jgi:hypothetical protein
MREMAKPNGAFKKWLPPEEHETEVINFFKDLVGAISKCNLRKISSAVWLGDLERFNTENCLALEPYPLATYSCLVRLSQEYDELPMTVIFDHVEKVDDKLRKARAYIDSDVKFRPLGGLCNNIAANPLQKCLTSRDVPALQAADFIAWEMRKALLQMKPWQSLPDRPLNDREAQWNHYLEWTRQTTGRNPLLRKSLDALLAKNKSASIVWDRHQLETTNEFRRGIWTLEGRRVTVSNALSAPSSVSLPGAR